MPRPIPELKFSIVIPVFNVEEYVEKCLRSCAEQDLPSSDYEIIVINDGSQDNSIRIVEDVAKEYSNIFIFSQKNLGLSAARNAGLSKAKGKYIWFVDADDSIEKNCLKGIWKESNGCDIIAMGLITTFIGETRVEIQNYNRFEIENGRDLLKDNFFPQVPAFVFCRAFLLRNNLKFYEGIFHEDTEFTPRMLYFAEKIKILKTPLYIVCKRPGSITSTFNSKKAFDNLRVAESLGEFSEKIEVVFRAAFSDRISLCINNALFDSGNMNKKQRQDLNLFIYNRRSLFMHLQRSSILKYRLEGLLFRIFPKNTVALYWFIQKFNKKSVQILI